jgi:ubiquitin carboxyl-terminal hydrolase 34
MDPEAAIPDSQQHTAFSSECTSARPKPFDDSDISARKRRRTYLSGSPPRSIDSTVQPQDITISAAILEGDDDTINGVKNMDVGTTPKTPEPSSSPSDPVTNPPSSKVTINLRKNTVSGLSEAMPHQLSPCPEREQEADSVELLEDTLARSLEEAIHKQSGSFSSTSRSPPVELVQIPEDEDVELEAAVEEVSPVGHDLYALDPTDQFPYNDPQEHLYETVNRLSQYVSSRKSPLIWASVR